MSAGSTNQYSCHGLHLCNKSLLAVEESCLLVYDIM